MTTLNKPKLLISSQAIDPRHCNTLGMAELMTYVVESDLFDVGFHDYGFDTIKANRQTRATIVFVNGKKVYVDFWEYLAPCYSDSAIQFGFDLIVKLQHKELNHKDYERICHRKKMMMGVSFQERHDHMDKVVPWTFFCSRMMQPYINREEELVHLPTERLLFFCGKNWKARHPMKERMEREGLEFIGSLQGTRSGKKFNDEDFLRTMLSSRFGIALHGRMSHFTEGKNRREIDYMMMKKPLLLNYKPCYYDPLIDGEHFIYVDTETSFYELENRYNVEEIAENAFQWYKRNASPKGAANCFKRIMEEHNII